MIVISTTIMMDSGVLGLDRRARRGGTDGVQHQRVACTWAQ